MHNVSDKSMNAKTRIPSLQKKESVAMPLSGLTRHLSKGQKAMEVVKV